MARALADALGFGLRLAAVGGDALEAGAWIFEKRRGPFRAASLPPLCPVHAPMIAGGVSEADTHRRRSPLDGLVADLSERYDQLTFALPPGADARPYLWGGWTARPRYTYRVRLDESFEARFSSSVRPVVRNKTDAVEIVEGASYGVAAVALTEAAYDRHDETLGIAPGAIRRLVDAVCATGLGRAFAAVQDGRPVAAFVLVSDGRDAAYWIAGSEPGTAMTVLLGTVLRQLREEGVQTVDLAGANVPGIAEFKRKFGGTLEVGHQVRIVPSRVLRGMDRLRGR